MKPLLSIYFVDFWPGFDIQNNFFTDVLSTRYTLVFDKDSPSLLIYSLFGFSFLKYNNSTRLVYIGENVRPSFWQSDFALSFDYSSSAGRNYRLPLYALYNKDKCKLLEPKNVDDIVKQKSKFCNMLVSNPRKCVRLDFFNILNNLKKVDSGGKVFNNIGRRVEDRFEFVSQYRFTIAFENSSYPGYITEKIAEPMKVNSIPIYWGSSTICQEFNAKSFINIHDFGSLREAAEYVVKVDESEELYRQMLSEPWFVNNAFNEYFDYDRLLDFFDIVIAYSPEMNTKKRKLKAYLHTGYKQVKSFCLGKGYTHIS